MVGQTEGNALKFLSYLPAHLWCRSFQFLEALLYPAEITQLHWSFLKHQNRILIKDKDYIIDKLDHELVDSGAEGNIKQETNAQSRSFFMGDHYPSHSGSNYNWVGMHPKDFKVELTDCFSCIKV